MALQGGDISIVRQTDLTRPNANGTLIEGRLYSFLVRGNGPFSVFVAKPLPSAEEVGALIRREAEHVVALDELS